MNLVAFDLPEETNEIREWLEIQLTGPNLLQVVTQLSAVHDDEDKKLSLDELCSEQWSSILQNGLTELSSEQLSQLLTHSYLLLELQERLLLEGEEYWQQHFLEQRDEQKHAQVKEYLLEQIQKTDTDPEAVQQETGYKKVAYRKIAILGFISTALVLIAVFLNQQPAKPGWGWDRPGALTADIPADQYLNQLADSANEWFNKPTETKAELLTRLKQFRHGCETLIKAPHPQLSQRDRTWLIERCQAWAGKLDDQITALDKGTDLKSADAAADALINKLIKALRERAQSIS
jgi:hypothetical protein